MRLKAKRRCPYLQRGRISVLAQNPVEGQKWSEGPAWIVLVGVDTSATSSTKLRTPTGHANVQPPHRVLEPFIFHD